MIMNLPPTPLLSHPHRTSDEQQGMYSTQAHQIEPHFHLFPKSSPVNSQPICFQADTQLHLWAFFISSGYAIVGAKVGK